MFNDTSVFLSAKIFSLKYPLNIPLRYVFAGKGENIRIECVDRRVYLYFKKSYSSI